MPKQCNCTKFVCIVQGWWKMRKRKAKFSKRLKFRFFKQANVFMYQVCCSFNGEVIDNCYNVTNITAKGKHSLLFTKS